MASTPKRQRSAAEDETAGPSGSPVTPGGGHLRPWIPSRTPEVASPASTASKKRKPSRLQRTPRSRRSLNSNIVSMLNDSGSDGECEGTMESEDNSDNDVVDAAEDYRVMRRLARDMRSRIVLGTDDGEDSYGSEEEIVNVVETNESMFEVQVECELIDMDDNGDVANVANVRFREESVVDENDANERGMEVPRSIAAARVDTTFSWSKDFTSFTGRKESYLRVPGPTFASHDPVEIFLKIWDLEFMEMVVKETNRYAWEVISQLSDPDNSAGIPSHLEAWADITVEELYRYFAIQILMSFGPRSTIQDFWETGVLGMPDFRKLMPRSRFNLISRFLHFVPNEELSSRGHSRKIAKVAPVVDHCNRKFAQLYTPSQHLSLEESLLLWRGRLSWKQCIRSKAAQFGIKSFELCEADTGYLLQYRLYAGKGKDMYAEPLHGFQISTANIVLDLMEGYLDVGHVLVMNNWYYQLLSLTRYLKARRTDVLATLNRRRRDVPNAIKDLKPKQMERGSVVSRHCGDIALVAWKDVSLVTVLSTYHQHEMVPGTRAGRAVLKPIAIWEYNQYMGGVDLKDKKISMFLMERTTLKWYMKVFRRLFNTSLLNAFIIYSKTPMHKVYSHRAFRRKVAEGLLSRFPRESSVLSRVPSTTLLRLQPGDHFPVHTEVVSGPGKAKHKQQRCVRCTALQRRVVVTLMCEVCRVPLCVGKCWKDYHTLVDLKKE